jgi:hypothetical protein
VAASRVDRFLEARRDAYVSSKSMVTLSEPEVLLPGQRRERDIGLAAPVSGSRATIEYVIASPRRTRTITRDGAREPAFS